MQARITGGIINIHLTVIIRNSTIGKYHVGNIADALPATRRDQKSGRFGNHFPRLHNGLVGGGAVFIRLPEPFAAGAGIDHLIQDKMVHIGGSSDIALVQRFSGIHLKGYLKTKKMTDIPQTQAGFKAKSLGILCGFQGFLTHNPAVFVEIEDIFDFSDPPWSKTHKYSLYSFQCFYFTVRYIGSISDPTEILFKPFFNRWPPKVSPVNHIEGV